MPSDLVLNVRQIAGYPPATSAGPADFVLLQRGGLGGPYLSISPRALVETALSTGGVMSISGALQVGTVDSGAATFSNAAVGLLDAQAATVANLAAAYGTLAGDPIATQAYAEGLVAALQAATVWSFNGRRGDVGLWIQDILKAGGAPIYSPRFMGEPRAETPAAHSNSSRLATTAFVQRNSVLYLDNLLKCHPFVFTFNGRSGEVVLTAEDIIAAGATLDYAPLDSPQFSGVPTAPTAPPGSQTGQLATTAFVMNAVQESTTGVASFNGRTGIVALSGTDIVNAGGALTASPVFSGTPQAPTAAPGTDSGQIATTAFVINELGGVTSGVQTFNGRAGAVTLTLADVTGGGGAPLADPAFNGVPTAPTAPTNTSTQQLATTAFVMTAVNAGSVVSFNGRTGAVTLTANDLSAASGVINPSPALLGTPTAPTAGPGTNTTQIATCAFVAAALAAAPGVASFNSRTGAVTLTNADVIAVLPSGGALPLVDGTASAGSATTWSRSDHVHPTDTSRYAASNPSGFQTASQVASALAAYLPLAGGTMTGGITITNGGINASSTITGHGSVAVFSTGGDTGFSCYSAASATLGAFQYQASSGMMLIYNATGGGTAGVAASGSFNISGQGYMPGGGPWLNLSSDARVKTVDGEYRQGLDEVLQLRPVVYRFKGNDTETADIDNPPSPHARVRDKKFVGLIAQELEGVFPEMVSKRGGFIDGKEVDDLRTLDTGPLIYALVNAVKALAARLQTLEARIA